MWRVLLMLALLLLALPTGAAKLPGTWSDDDSLQDIIKGTRESDIENSRTPSPTRKASEYKYPWKGDSVGEMEDMVWNDYKGRTFPPPNIDWVNPDVPKPDKVTPEEDKDAVGWKWYTIGCWINAPPVIWCEEGCFEITIETSQVVCGVKIVGQVLPQGEKVYDASAITTPDKIVKRAPVLFAYGPEEVQDPYNPDWYADAVLVGDQYTSYKGSYIIRICPSPNQADYGKISIEVATCPLSGQAKGGSCTKEILVRCGGCNCVGRKPTVYPQNGEVAASASLGMWVENDGMACPPYSWSVSGSGYSLTKSETQADMEINTLNASGSVCGNATVVTTDQCGLTSSAIVSCSGICDIISTAPYQEDPDTWSWLSGTYDTATAALTACEAAYPGGPGDWPCHVPGSPGADPIMASWFRCWGSWGCYDYGDITAGNWQWYWFCFCD